MEWKQKYEKWVRFNLLESELKEELESIKGDEELLKDKFNRNLEFGTAGIRAEIGVGTNRLNKYTIRKATEGLAQSIVNQGIEAKTRGVVIAYDSRHKSKEFAVEVASTLGAHGITTYVFESLRPTPELSFAIRHLQTYRGIVITASHNPPEYNGFKVYGEDGGQLPPKDADKVMHYMNKIENELAIQVADTEELLEKGLLRIIGEGIDKEYIEKLKTVIINPELINRVGDDLKIVFTPLHGAANMPVRRSLEAVGFNHVTIVKEQEMADPNFSTVESPNPEERNAFTLAIQYGQAIDADILVATDPDGDRVGVAVRNDEGEFVVLTGNQTGALMVDYLLSEKAKQGILQENSVVLKSIVTSDLGRAIVDSYGLTTVDVLTGFKYIAEKISQYEETGEYVFHFGYEESNGYLVRDFVRDKDAVQAILLLCEVAAYYKLQGKSLYGRLMTIYEKFAFYQEEQVSFTLKGKDGTGRIQNIMDNFRKNTPSIIGKMNVVHLEDYLESKSISMTNGITEDIDLPQSNILKYYLEDGSWFCLRPSGTEPKIKLYFEAKGSSKQESEDKLKAIKKCILEKVEKVK